MKNRFSALILALALMLIPARAEKLTDEMERFTVQVKETLGIEDEYDSFSIDSYSGNYYLDWSGENRSAMAQVNSEGTVFWFYAYEDSGYDRSSGFQARFPAVSEEEIFASATAFMDRITAEEGWGYRLESIDRQLASGSSPRAWLNGCLTFGGFPSDIYISLSVDVNTGRVMSYYRGDSGRLYASIISAENPAVTSEQAKARLYEEFRLKTVYRVTDPMEMAHLVYVKDGYGETLLRADTGEIIEPSTEVSYAKASAENAMTDESIKAAGLTVYEKEGISIYDGVLTGEELEAVVRGIKSFGLTDEYALESVDYITYDAKPCAQLVFTRGDIRRSVSVDAKDGSLISAYAYNNEESFEADGSMDAAAFEGAARAFLAECFPDYPLRLTGAQPCEGLSADIPCARLGFTREYDGYLFESDGISVTVNAADGTVCAFNLSWDDGQEFFSAPETLIGDEAAKQIYLGQSEPAIIYTAVRNADEQWELVPVWHLVNVNDITGADAGTGAEYRNDGAEKVIYTYDDVSGMLCADEIAQMGLYGVGIPGAEYTENEACTAEQLMRLILGTDGVYYDDQDISRTFARWYGTAPSDELTRAELARVLVYVAGYGNAAELTGIYSLDVPGFEDVTEEYRGSVAIAWALGLMEASGDGNVNPASPALTAEAMHGLYALLSR